MNTPKTTVQVIEQYRKDMGVRVALPGVMNREFGLRHALAVEQTIFSVTSRLLPDYRGAMWELIQLQNGGFYMALDMRKQYRCRVEGNGFDGPLSGDAAGLVVCLMTYSELSFSSDEELSRRVTKHFHAVRDYCGEHPEGLNIFPAID